MGSFVIHRHAVHIQYLSIRPLYSGMLCTHESFLLSMKQSNISSFSIQRLASEIEGFEVATRNVFSATRPRSSDRREKEFKERRTDVRVEGNKDVRKEGYGRYGRKQQEGKFN